MAMTTPQDESALIPEKADEEDFNDLPDNDPKTDGVDPDKQGAEGF